MISTPLQAQFMDRLEERFGSREPERWHPCVAEVSAVDPQTGCVKVIFDTYGTTSTGEPVESDWLPVALPMAGIGAVCFLPTPGTRAVVLYLNGFRTHAVVSGFLPKALPEEVRQGDRGIFLGNDPNSPRVVFQEKTDKHGAAVLISDGAGNNIEIRSKDHSIEITAAKGSGSPSSITLTKDKVTIKAAHVEIEGTTQLKIDGKEIVATADGDFSINGKRVLLNC